MMAGAAYLLINSIIGAWALKLAPVVNALGRLTVEAGKPMIEWRKASFRAPISAIIGRSFSSPISPQS